MRHHNTRRRTQTHNHIANTHQILDPVVDKIYLSVTSQLRLDNLLDQLLGEGVRLGLDRTTVWRRRGDNREVARTHQRELQSTRYRCRGECQRVDAHSHLRKSLLGSHTEALLLVDNQQSQIIELDTLAEHLMCSYQDIYLTTSQLLQDTRCILRTLGTIKILYRNREVTQTALE